MNKYERKSLECKIGIKAFQNTNAAYLGFSRMASLDRVADEVTLPSIFHWSVIRYSKLFLDTKKGFQYPIKNLKKVAGFSIKIHNHILEIRNTLIAHDDFTEIQPRILKFGFRINDSDFFIPTSIAISNKCISFPSNIETVAQMRDHTKSTTEAIYMKLMDDINELRNICIKNPELYEKAEKYKNDYGKITVTEENKTLKPPNFMSDPWLVTPTPDFSEINNGYKYEEAKIKRDFNGPETITLPDGKEIEIESINNQ